MYFGMRVLCNEAQETKMRDFWRTWGNRKSCSCACDVFVAGLKLRPGVATSKDGLALEDWEGPTLELGKDGAWNGVGVSWPRVLRLEGK